MPETISDPPVMHEHTSTAESNSELLLPSDDLSCLPDTASPDEPPPPVADPAWHGGCGVDELVSSMDEHTPHSSNCTSRRHSIVASEMGSLFANYEAAVADAVVEGGTAGEDIRYSAADVTSDETSRARCGKALWGIAKSNLESLQSRPMLNQVLELMQRLNQSQAQLRIASKDKAEMKGKMLSQMAAMSTAKASVDEQLALTTEKLKDLESSREPGSMTTAEWQEILDAERQKWDTLYAEHMEVLRQHESEAEQRRQLRKEIGEMVAAKDRIAALEDEAERRQELLDGERRAKELLHDAIIELKIDVEHYKAEAELVRNATADTHKDLAMAKRELDSSRAESVALLQRVCELEEFVAQNRRIADSLRDEVCSTKAQRDTAERAASQVNEASEGTRQQLVASRWAVMVVGLRGALWVTAVLTVAIEFRRGALMSLEEKEEWWSGRASRSLGAAEEEYARLRMLSNKLNDELAQERALRASAEAEAKATVTKTMEQMVKVQHIADDNVRMRKELSTELLSEIEENMQRWRSHMLIYASISPILERLLQHEKLFGPLLDTWQVQSVKPILELLKRFTAPTDSLPSHTRQPVWPKPFSKAADATDRTDTKSAAKLTRSLGPFEFANAIDHTLEVGDTPTAITPPPYKSPARELEDACGKHAPNIDDSRRNHILNTARPTELSDSDLHTEARRAIAAARADRIQQSGVSTVTQQSGRSPLMARVPLSPPPPIRLIVHDSSNPPLKPSASPLKPSASPLKPSASPLKPSASPLKPSASPLKPSASPRAKAASHIIVATPLGHAACRASTAPAAGSASGTWDLAQLEGGKRLKPQQQQQARQTSQRSISSDVTRWGWGR